MDQVKDNPAANALPKGIEEEALKEAITRSGYPLQMEIVGFLRKTFTDTKSAFSIIEEEWSYVDRDSNSLRSLDIYAQVELWNFETGQPRVRPAMTLLIECKKSEHPFIFFEAASADGLADFPMMVGMPFDNVGFQVEVMRRLRLDEPTSQPATCTTFAKAQPDGKKVSLSGSEPFNTLVLPLTKAMEYFARTSRPTTESRYWDCRAVLAVAVLDAPMILVEVGAAGPDIRLAPWIRLMRQEADRANEGPGGSAYYSIDLVHARFFDQYMDTIVAPLAESLREAVMREQRELLLMLGQDEPPGERSDEPPDVIIEVDHDQH
jgi:hypothetical protein